MNLILLEPHEIIDGEAHLSDRRARHIAGVIHPAPGATLRVGVIGGARGDAQVLSVAPESVRLAVRLEGSPSPPPRVHLVLAVPRPKVLGRVLQTLGALGVARLDLVNAWRVEKSYFGSPALQPPAIRQALVLGAEQGATTWLPDFEVHPRLMGYLDQSLTEPQAVPPAAPGLRVVAHPRSETQLESVVTPGPASCLVAIGPEGGWIEREVETFEARGFVPITLGPAILRTEQAVAVLLGQLALLERS